MIAFKKKTRTSETSAKTATSPSERWKNGCALRRRRRSTSCAVTAPMSCSRVPGCIMGNPNAYKEQEPESKDGKSEAMVTTRYSPGQGDVPGCVQAMDRRLVGERVDQRFMGERPTGISRSFFKS